MLAAPRAEDERSGNESGARSAATAPRSIMSKSATKEATTRYAQKFAGRAAEGHFREAHRLVLSSLGIRTYLGQPDAKTDEGYAAAALVAVESGINVIDAHMNYRVHLPERNIADAVKHLPAK